MLSTRKAQELDVVELTEDLPEFGLKKGEMGAVVAVLDSPDEVYDLEFVDESGQSRLAYSVKHNQIRSIDEAAREILARGIRLHNEGRGVEAEREFRQAIELNPDLIEELHNRIVKSFEGTEAFEQFAYAMRLILRICPSYELAQINLAIAYENQGVQEAHKGNYGAAIMKFTMALAIRVPNEILISVRENLAKAYTHLGLEASNAKKIDEALGYLEMACQVDPNERTRKNLGAVYAHLGWNYLTKREYKNAIRAFEYSIDMGLEADDVLNDLGVAYVQSGETGKAIGMFERALKIVPNNQIVAANLKIIRKVIAEGGVAENLRLEDVSAEFNTVLSIEAQSYRIAA